MTKATLTRLRSLRDKKNRDALGLFIVENEKVVQELLNSGHRFAEIYHTSAWQGDASSGTTAVHSISTAEMARISHYPTPSSVFAVGTIERKMLDPVSLNRGFTLALDGIQDAGNLGTLLRIADWFAFERVVASPDCVDVYNQKVINASMGSFRRVPFHVADLSDVLKGLRVPVFGCDLAGENLHSLQPQKDAVVVIGSEGQGISSAVRACISRFITIPKYGAAESLNAGVAAAIVCDNLRRQQNP